MLGASAEFHVERNVRPHDLPWIAEPQPLVREFHLPPVADRLVEDAELVADAVADGRDAETGERIHVARGQAAQPAVAEAGLLLLVEQVAEVLPDARQGLLRRAPDVEIDEAVAQVRPDQKFSGEIRDQLRARVPLNDRFRRCHTAVEQPIAHRIGQRHVPVVARREPRRLGQQELKVLDQRLGNRIGTQARSNRLSVRARFWPRRRLTVSAAFHWRCSRVRVCGGYPGPQRVAAGRAL